MTRSSARSFLISSWFVGLMPAVAQTPPVATALSELAPRVPRTEMGIAQLPNEKLDWFLDAKFGMFIHWGLYSGPGRGEWVMEHEGISPEKYSLIRLEDVDPCGAGLITANQSTTS